MATDLRVWKKQEKRIVRLLYRKGFLKDYKVHELYMASYGTLRVQKKKHGRTYRKQIYLPEVHYWTVDYWGECDEHSLVNSVLQNLYWDNVTGEKDERGYYISAFKYKGRNWFIKYLKKFPTVRTDSKINKVFKNYYE